MACGGIRKAYSLGVLFLALAFAAPSPSIADSARVGFVVDAGGGYARLIFTMGEMSEEVDASARVAGNVLIVNFTKPVQVSVDRIAAQAPDYIAAARRDPDGKAIRLALARKVRVNSMTAGEKFFVDLLPDTWNGAPPALPPDVIEELARRAREAERLERLAHLASQQKRLPPVRVRVARQPTFMRYVFDVPEQISVTADGTKDRLTLTFDAPITFDLADAAAALPAAIAAINSEVEDHSALVHFSFLAKVDVRSFREDKSYVVDVVGADAKPPENGEAAEGAALAATLAPGPAEKSANESAASSAAGAPAIAAKEPNSSPPATVAAPARELAKPAAAEAKAALQRRR
jgi:hypothetical protein